MRVRHESYSKEFKDAIVTKIMNRGEKTMIEICEEEGVNNSTAANWLQTCVKPLGMSKKNSKNWSAEQKLKKERFFI